MEGYQNYKEVEIETASGLKLVVMLYQGAIKFLNIAKESNTIKRYDIVNTNIIKAQDIISELISSLNFEAGEIAQNLYSLYLYINRRLLEANIQKNMSIIEEVIGLLQTLKEAWEVILTNQKPVQAEQHANKRLNVSG